MFFARSSRPTLPISVLLLVHAFTTTANAAIAASTYERPDLLAQTGAVCSDTFAWMQNSLRQSPCLAASFVIGACASGDWNVPALKPGNKYDYPNATTANGCSCSWSAYNLLSACTVCQGQTPTNWDAYNQQCGSFDTTYFPSNITLPVETAIAYWAITDPSTWTDAHFDTSRAYAIANQEHPDITSGTIKASATAAKHKKSAGPIVGAVIGALAFLGIIALVITWYILYKRKRTPKQTVQVRHILQQSLSTNTLPEDITSASTIGHSNGGMQQIDMYGNVPVSSVDAMHSNSTPIYPGMTSTNGGGGHGHATTPWQSLVRMASARWAAPSDVEPFYGIQARYPAHPDTKDPATTATRALHAVNQAPSPSPPPAVVSITRATAGSSEAPVPDEHSPVSPPAYTLLPAPVPASAVVPGRVRSLRYGHKRGPFTQGGSIDSNASSSTVSRSGSQGGGGSLSRLIDVTSVGHESASGAAHP